jgi:integrase
LCHSIYTVADPLSEAVAQTISRFGSRATSEEATCFAKQLTTSARPDTPARAKAFLFAASRLAAFGEQVGLDLKAEVLLHRSVIERFCEAKGSAMSGPTRRTLRTNLRALARRVLLGEAEPPSLPRERAKAPYSPSEIASYLALADAQPTVLRRARAGALICLGAGAGLIGAELRRVRGSDVVCRSGGVLVAVDGRRSRVVPVLAAFHDRLGAAAEFFGEAYLVSGTNPESHNVTNPLIRSLSGGSDLPRLEPGRLRSTYLSTTAKAIGLKAFMDAAGIVCSQRLGDLVAHLEAVDEGVAVALLGASA